METTDTEVQNVETENYYEGCWFRFTDGRLVQTDVPEWAKGNRGIGTSTMESAGYVTVNEWSGSQSPSPMLSIILYEKAPPPHWVVLFFEAGFQEYVVEIDNFPDWLGFRRYIAPIITADVVRYLEYLAKRTLDTVLPDKRRC